MGKVEGVIGFEVDGQVYCKSCVHKHLTATSPKEEDAITAEDLEGDEDYFCDDCGVLLS